MTVGIEGVERISQWFPQKLESTLPTRPQTTFLKLKLCMTSLIQMISHSMVRGGEFERWRYHLVDTATTS